MRPSWRHWQCKLEYIWPNGQRKNVEFPSPESFESLSTNIPTSHFTLPPSTRARFLLVSVSPLLVSLKTAKAHKSRLSTNKLTKKIGKFTRGKLDEENAERCDWKKLRLVWKVCVLIPAHRCVTYFRYFPLRFFNLMFSQGHCKMSAPLVRPGNRRPHLMLGVSTLERGLFKNQTVE